MTFLGISIGQPHVVCVQFFKLRLGNVWGSILLIGCYFAQHFSRYLIFAELETISLVPLVAKNFTTLSDKGIEIKLDPLSIFDVSDRL